MSATTRLSSGPLRPGHYCPPSSLAPSFIPSQDPTVGFLGARVWRREQQGADLRAFAGVAAPLLPSPFSSVPPPWSWPGCHLEVALQVISPCEAVVALVLPLCLLLAVEGVIQSLPWTPALEGTAPHWHWSQPPLPRPHGQ